MKKYVQRALALMLALTLVFSTAACASSDNAGESGTETSITSEETASAEASESSAESESAAESESSEEASSSESSAAESASSEEAAEFNIAVLKGPTALGMLDVMDKAKNSPDTLTDHYNFTLAGSADEILGDIIQGNYDIAAVPTNVASILYNKTQGQVQMLAMNTLGVLYIVSDDDSITSIEDLKGQTIYAHGQGAVPEYVLRYVLEQNGLDPDTDVTIEFRSEASEVASILASGEGHVAMLPQPFVTSVLTQNPSFKAVIDMTEEWSKVGNGSELTMGCLVVQKTFAEEHPEAVTRFLGLYEESVKKTNEDPETAGQVAEEFDILKAAVASKAIPECNIVYITGDEMKEKAGGFLQVLYDIEPASVGGAVPGDDFYYMPE